MFSVIFEVHPTIEQFDLYLALAKDLRPILQSIDGFIDNERFESTRRPGWILSHSTWRDEKSVVRWRTVAKHHETQQRGRDDVFQDYHLRVGLSRKLLGPEFCAVSCSIIPCSNAPELSNNIIQKRLAFDRDWSGTVLTRARKARPEILPRWLHRRRGASVVRRDAASTERRISMSTAAKKSVPASTFPVIAAKPSLSAPNDTTSKKVDPGSKQSRVIAMLQSPMGTTIAAMMKTTGWQRHSVRGFLAGVVRKRLKLKLSSKKVDGNRIYRIAGASNGKTGARSSRPS
jgi:heme-degrading monooxygenase HmoA